MNFITTKTRYRRTSDAVLISLPAKLIASLISIIFSLPFILIGLQNNKELETFHNRILRGIPVSSFTTDPVKYFQDIKAWAADRIYPIIQTSTICKKILFYVLHSPPQQRVTIGSHGYIFLNGVSDESVFGLFTSSCIDPHTKAAADKLKEALEIFSKWTQLTGIRFDVVIVPTLPSIYADNLTSSVTEDIKNSCLELARGHTPLVMLAKKSDGHFNYPLLEMNAARDDEAFYPKANYHPDGLSLKIVRDAYLSAQHLAIPENEQTNLDTSPSEILLLYKIIKNFPIYRIQNIDVIPDSKLQLEIIEKSKHLFDKTAISAFAFSSPNAPNKETVFMISDSFGNLASKIFAGAFRHLLHITTNAMPNSNFHLLLDEIKNIEHYDRVILLVQEGNFERIVDYAKDLIVNIQLKNAEHGS
jgi:hypothetical protein